MNYISLIEELKKRGSIPGLDAIQGLLEELGHPEDGLKIVHIAGTNGKGSIFAYLSSILMAAGFKVGRYISPTILKDVTTDDKVMSEELFGPILPVLKYKNMEDLKYFISINKNPLAFYVFSEDENFSEDVINRFSFGGGCVNDTISHVASKYLPFGGIGASGMGNYHGKTSFDTFTHTKAIVKKNTKLDINLVFPTYKNKINLIKKIMK